MATVDSPIKWGKVGGSGPQCPTPMFRGRYPATVDAKGRVSIPARFREVLGRYEAGDLVVVPDGECLEVYPLAEWERMEAVLREQSRFNSEVRGIGRVYVQAAKDGTLGGAARLP